MTAPELLPCPFCGGTKIGWRYVETYSLDSSYGVFGCEDCEATFCADDDDGPTTEDIAAWNRRTHPPEVQALIAEARREGWSAAIEAAGALVDGSVYTSNGGDRTLEPVSPKMRGMDMHHATIAAAIRTLREETP